MKFWVKHLIWGIYIYKYTQQSWQSLYLIENNMMPTPVGKVQNNYSLYKHYKTQKQC